MPEHPLLRRAVALHEAGRLEEARESYRRFLAANGRHALAWQSLGFLLHQLGDSKGSRTALARAIACAPKAPECREGLGRVLRAQGDLPGARSAFVEALDLRPDFVDARYQLGTVHHDLEDTEAAAECYRRVVADAPDHVPGWNSLGSVHLENGELEEAERAFRRALALKADYVPARLNLAVAQRRQGRFDEAGDLLGDIVRAHPGLAEAHHNLALVHRERGELEEAEGEVRRALSLRPDDPRMLHTLAAVCLDRSRLGLAADLYQRCVEHDPEDVEAWNQLATIQLTRGEVEAATEAVRRALALEPDNPAVLCTLANTHSVAGKREEAERCCRRALEIQPDLPVAWHTLTQLRRFRDSDRETIAHVESISERRKLGPTGLGNLHFALGRMHHDCKHFDRAFSHFERGNRVLRKRREFSVEKWTRRIDATIETFDAGLFSRTRGFGDPTPQPVFVFGMPRSGTSLVEQILASHSEVHGAGEILAMPDCAQRLAFGTGPDAEYPSAAGGIGAGLARSLAGAYLKALRRGRSGARRITDKLPGNYAHLGLIAILLPGARLVHCRRNPIDVCLSNYMQQYGEGHAYAYDLTELGLVYCQYERIMRHWRQVLPVEIHEVAYEELVADQERRSRELIAFCGLEWEDACLDFHANQRTVATASQWQVRQPIYRGSLNRWRPYEAHLGELFEALGDSVPEL